MDDFYKFPTTFFCKSSPRLLGYFKQIVKTDVATFWHFWKKLGNFLIPKSGHVV